LRVFEGCVAPDPFPRQVTKKDALALCRITLVQSKAINAAILVSPLRTRQIEAPFSTIRQYAYRHAFVEGILEQLTVAIGCTAETFYFDKHGRPTPKTQQGEIYPSSA